jgi:hypothetical protein
MVKEVYSVHVVDKRRKPVVALESAESWPTLRQRECLQLWFRSLFPEFWETLPAGQCGIQVEVGTKRCEFTSVLRWEKKTKYLTQWQVILRRPPPQKLHNSLSCRLSAETKIKCVRFDFGRAIAQAVSRWLPTVAARVRFRVCSSGICGGQSG